MIRYHCSKCDEKMLGGPEDKKCPLCGGTLVFDGVIEKYD